MNLAAGGATCLISQEEKSDIRNKEWNDVETEAGESEVVDVKCMCICERRVKFNITLLVDPF